MKKLCSCEGVDMIGLAIAALATGVVYMFITMEGGEKQKRRAKRNYEFKYNYDSYLQGIRLLFEQSTAIIWQFYPMFELH